MAHNIHFQLLIHTRQNHYGMLSKTSLRNVFSSSEMLPKGPTDKRATILVKMFLCITLNPWSCLYFVPVIESTACTRMCSSKRGNSLNNYNNNSNNNNNAVTTTDYHGRLFTRHLHSSPITTQSVQQSCREESKEWP